MEALYNVAQYDVSVPLEPAKYFSEMLQFRKEQLYSRDDSKKSSNIHDRPFHGCWPGAL